MLLVGATFCSSAQPINDDTRNAFITSFIEAQQINDVNALKKLLVKNPIIAIPGRNGDTEISKTEYLTFLKQAGQEQQQCNPSFEILIVTPESFIAQVDFMYVTYAYRNIIKAEKKEGTWKITELKKSFLAAPAPVVVMH